MSVVFESVGTFSSNTTGTTIAIDAPAGVQVGDLLVAHLVTSVNTQWDLTGEPNFTSIQTVSHSDTGTVYVAVAYKVADSDDANASSFTFTNNGNSHKGGRIYRFSGQATTSPINASSSGQASGSSTITASTITPSVADCMIVFFGASDSGGTGATVTTSGYALATDDISWTEGYDDDQGDFQVASAYGTRLETSATGNATATLSDSLPNAGVLIAIAPEPQSQNVTVPVTNITINAIAPTVNLSHDVSVPVTNITINAVNPTVTQTAFKVSNKDKSSASNITNLDKS